MANGRTSDSASVSPDTFPSFLPAKPYCVDDFNDGLKILPKSSALQKRHLQLNGPSTFQWMIQDIDQRDAYFAHYDANLPPPNYIAFSARGHAHSAYLLATPVARHKMAHLKPLRFYAAVERGIRNRLGADENYKGLIAKNPTHEYWRVEWRQDRPYLLEELESSLFERDMRPEPLIEKSFGASRNVIVFDELRAIAYREVREYMRNGEPFDVWRARCERLALGLNMQFPHALKLSESRAIARSVARWTWKKFSLADFSARQSYLGKRGMEKRWAGHLAAEKTKPWETEGVSRRTWYRRKKAHCEIQTSEGNNGI